MLCSWVLWGVSLYWWNLGLLLLWLCKGHDLWKMELYICKSVDNEGWFELWLCLTRDFTCKMSRNSCEGAHVSILFLTDSSNPLNMSPWVLPHITGNLSVCSFCTYKAHVEMSCSLRVMADLVRGGPENKLLQGSNLWALFGPFKIDIKICKF